MSYRGRGRRRNLLNKRWYYIKDETGSELLQEIRGETSACAIDPARELAARRGAPVLLQNEDGRNLARYHPDGRHDYLGY